MKTLLKSVLVALLAVSGLSVWAAESTTMKHEMRSTWLTTVWRIDWPTTVSDGSEAKIAAQKKEMTKILDSLAVNNFNAVNFQVRTMSDAFYKSSYEPWSSWLTGTRGKDPGWDPLEFVVEECHKRGMECHAWVNPYRFASESSEWASGGDGTNYVENGWIIGANSSTKILNPGKPEVIEHLVKVLQEIVVNYDIDGMLFDDYYYNSASDSGDASDYAAYTATGGELSKADWRRDNIHTFIKKLYEMIQEAKPWVRFGQAPPGTTYTTASLAAKYDLEPCPVGYELCYSSQYVDIMRWLNDGIIDYISPQVYWAIGSSSDYSKIVPWWGKVAKHFDRHLFVSQTIQYLNSGSNNMRYFSEFKDQIELNRSSSLNGSTGSIFYSQKFVKEKQGGQTFGNYLKAKVFQMPAIMPAMTWKTATNPGKVAGLDYDGTSELSWTPMTDTVYNRYTVYAVPNGVEPTAFAKEHDYLLGCTYGSTYTIPEKYRSGYYFAVCVYDRYGNEWDAATWQANYSETVAAPTLVSPASGMVTDEAFDFTWNAVSGAEKYALDVATDANFLNVQKSIQTTETKLSSEEVYSAIDKNVPIYWRVRAIAKGKNDGVSETRYFTYNMTEFITPVNESEELDPKVYFSWNVTSEGAAVTLQVATDLAFENIVMTAESTTGSYQTPICSLRPRTTYYARLVLNGKYSATVMFKTKTMPVGKPAFKTPTNGGVCYADGKIEIEPQEGAEVTYIQVGTTAEMASKYQAKLTDFVFGVNASDVKIGRKNPMENGNTYYACAYCEYYDENGTYCTSEMSDVISFVYSTGSSAVESVAGDTEVKLVDGNVVIGMANEARVTVSAVTMAGQEQVLYDANTASEQVSLDGLAKGFYVIKVVAGGEARAFKFVK